MALSDSAIITDVEDVWNYLEATEAHRQELTVQMENWINGASALLERMCKRKLKEREYDGVTQDGSGRRWLYLDQYPVSEVEELTIHTPDFITSYEIDVDESITLNAETGRISLKGFTVVGTFLRGHDNITLKYTAGFTGDDLLTLGDAVKELIAIRWREIGGNPLEFFRADTMGSNASFNKFDPRRLPHIVQHTIDYYMRREF